MKKKLTRAKLLLNLPGQDTQMRYATGFSAPDYAVYLGIGSQQYLVVPVLEYGRAKRQAEGVEVLSTEQLNLSAKKRGKLSEWIIALLKRTGVKSVDVPWTFPLLITQELRKAGFKVSTEAKAFFPERAVKSAEEVELIREVQQSAVIAMRAAIREIGSADIDERGFLKRGTRRLTSDGIRHIIDHVLLDRNCIAKDTIVACGKRGADPHERGSGYLKAGEPIVMDIFPRSSVHGYWGDLTRTVVKGEPSKELLKMYRAVKAAQTAALRKIRPRVHTSSVHKEVQRVFDSKGFKTDLKGAVPQGFIHGTGHGVGLDIHEAPSIGQSRGVLRAGHVVTVEPGLYYSHLGGIRIEDTVVVTSTGWKYLFPCENKFQI